MIDYIICHDLPEAITGDITKFEGVSDDEIKSVTGIAIEYVSSQFGDILNFSELLNGYENRVDIEAKIVHMIDKVHSAATFIKYQSENNIDMDDPRIIPELRYHPFVDKKIAEGKDLADIFFEFHLSSVNITDEECQRYSITRDEGNQIVSVIRSFAYEMYSQKLGGTLLEFKNDLPEAAMIYNRRKKC